MNLYPILSKLVPEGIFKDKLRLILYTYFRNAALKGYNRKYKLKKGDIVIDCGAFPAEYSIYASKMVGKKGKVICFEPNKENFDAVVRVTKRRKNILIINKGLWDKDTSLKITKDKQGARIVDSGKSFSFIKVVSLDNELRRLRINHVDFIKMDIEGAEIKALQGMKNTLKKYSVNLAIASYHIVGRERTYKKVERILRTFGYKASTKYPKHLTTYGCKIQK